MEAFPTRLKELRERYQMTLQHLADQLNVSKQAVHRLESGEMKPSSELLLNVCEIFNKPYEYFREIVEDRYQLQQICFRHNSEKGVKQVTLLEIKQEVLDEVTYFIDLENLLGIERTFENPLADLGITDKKDVEKAAKQLRKKWKLGNVPIADVVDTLENKGVYVVEVCYNEDFSGLSTMMNEEIPVVVLNRNVRSIERKRLTAFHELAHLILKFAKHLDEETIERYCNHFAGAVLITDEALLEELGKKRLGISFSELKRIKETYGISIQAIIFRASETGYISPSDLSSWLNAYEEWKNNEMKIIGSGNFLGREKPTRKETLLVRALAEKRIMWSKAAQIMHTNIDHLKTMFGSAVLAIRN
jgi:Zn-dependent peptidase ImmA (M78 family)